MAIRRTLCCACWWEARRRRRGGTAQHSTGGGGRLCCLPGLSCQASCPTNQNQMLRLRITLRLSVTGLGPALGRGGGSPRQISCAEKASHQQQSGARACCWGLRMVAWVCSSSGPCSARHRRFSCTLCPNIEARAAVAISGKGCVVVCCCVWHYRIVLGPAAVSGERRTFGGRTAAHRHPGCTRCAPRRLRTQWQRLSERKS